MPNPRDPKHALTPCARAHIAAALQLYLTVEEVPFEILHLATQAGQYEPMGADEIISLAYHLGHDIINPRDEDHANIDSDS
jgi:hypothetical protein